MTEHDTGATVGVHRNVALAGSVAPAVAVVVGGYGAAPTGEVFGAVGRKADKRQPTNNKRASPKQTPEARAALRAAWMEARSATTSLLQAIKEDDPQARFIAADDLQQALCKLWQQRECRDVNWQTILNHAQGMLKQLFAEKRIESLTHEQGTAIQALVEQCLGPATKSLDDLTEAVRLIEDAGCDPFYAISGDPEDEQEK